MSYYMDYPDWFDTEWEDFDKPCPECGGKMKAGVMFDQGCYEGLVYRCTDKKCGSQWAFRDSDYIPPYWITPPCPACRSLEVDYEWTRDYGTRYTCQTCNHTFTDTDEAEK